MSRNAPFAWPFSPGMLAAGFGALWCADYEHPLLVRVDAESLETVIWASFGPGEEGGGEETAGREAPASRGPQAVCVGLGAVWLLPRTRDQLLRVDPDDGAVERHELPFPLAGLAAGAGALLGVEARGEGRVLRFVPGRGSTVVAAGQALQLVAASDEFVWAVDDWAGEVLAFDSRSLSPVRGFRHVGQPEALCARGSQAWYVCAAAADRLDEHGRRSRTMMLGPGGAATDVLRLDAATGNAQRIGRLAGGHPSDLALTGGSLWLAGARREEDDADEPTTTLRRIGLDGRELGGVELPGTIDAVAADGERVWTAGFRRSRQEHVVVALGADGAVIAETGFAHLDLGPWRRAAPPAGPALPLAERARALRESVELELSVPRQTESRFGERWEEPPVCEEFRLERVEVQSPAEAPRIAVLFRWTGEDDLFGLSYPVPLADEDGDVPETYISVYVEEYLLAAGYGIENAIREPAGGVTWLRWV